MKFALKEKIDFTEGDKRLRKRFVFFKKIGWEIVICENVQWIQLLQPVLNYRRLSSFNNPIPLTWKSVRFVKDGEKIVVNIEGKIVE